MKKIIIDLISVLTLVFAGTVSQLPVKHVEKNNFVATAYSLKGRTASGAMVRKGIIAADPKVLPIGSKVYVDTGLTETTGNYLVADTGGAIKKNRIDIWIPSTRAALRFGKRPVKLTIYSWPQKKQGNGKTKKT